MFYKNIKKFKQTEEKNLEFSIFEQDIDTQKDDSVKKPNECKMFYNLSYQNGALTTGLGFRDLRVPASADNLGQWNVLNFSNTVTKIQNFWIERWFNVTYQEYVYQLLLMDSDKTVYGALMLDEYDGLFAPRTTLMTSMPTYQCPYRVNDADATLFFTNEGLVAIGQYLNMKYENVPAMISCVTHYGYFFGILATSRSTFVYTDNLDITEWADDTGSTIELMDNLGAFIKLLVFNDYVYLFREHGITKISIYTSKNDFSFTHLYTSTSKIFENSICVCGNKVLFLTRDGLYSFNGSSVSKICQEYDEYFRNCDNTNCSCACLDGKYYLSTKCNFSDDIVGCEANSTYTNNALFEIDLNDFKLNLLRGVDIKKILAIDTPYFSKLCAIFNDKDKSVGELCFCGKDFSLNTKKVWKSANTDLGYLGKDKKIKEIIIKTKYPCSVEISSNEETKTYNFEGKDFEQRLPVSVYGKTFEFCFKTDQSDCEICKPKIVFDVVK